MGSERTPSTPLKIQLNLKPPDRLQAQQQAANILPKYKLKWYGSRVQSVAFLLLDAVKIVRNS
jgi:hypothetical protein